MIENKSKPLLKTDDCAAEFFMRLFDGDGGRGFDVEGMYFSFVDGVPHWTIIELLKCDTCKVEDSHPSRYWHMNKRKFLSLWALRQVLNRGGFTASLILINYNKNFDVIKYMVAEEICEEYIITKDRIMTFDEYKEIFRKWNKEKKGDTWDALEHLEKLNDNQD